MNDDDDARPDEARPDGWAAVPHTDDLRGAQLPHEPAGPSYGFPYPAAAGTGPQGPPRRRLARKTVVGIVAGGAAVVLLLVLGIVGYSVGSSTHSPARPVEAFLTDLESGHVSSALRAAGVTADDDDVLLTDAAYADASDRVTAHSITTVRTSGDSARVSASLRQGGQTIPTTFTLSRRGTEFGVFPVWHLDPVSLGSVDVTLQGPARTRLTVGGRQVRTGADGAVVLRALPGTYDVAVDGGDRFEATATSSDVAGFGASSTTPTVLRAELTDGGEQAAVAAVDAWVDGCIASATAEPEGCSFYAYGEDPSNTYSNQKWTLATRPTVTVGEWTSRGWGIVTSAPGSASFTADFTGPSGAGYGSAGPIDVYADGYVTGFTDAGATYVAAVSGRSSTSGS